MVEPVLAPIGDVIGVLAHQVEAEVAHRLILQERVQIRVRDLAERLELLAVVDDANDKRAVIVMKPQLDMLFARVRIERSFGAQLQAKSSDDIATRRTNSLAKETPTRRAGGHFNSPLSC